VNLTVLERAAIAAIRNELGGDQPEFDEQIQALVVERRENTGGGFFTHLRVNRGDARPFFRSLTSYELFTDVSGMAHPLGLILFSTDGYLSLIEGYTLAGESTATIDFETVSFGPVTKWPTSWNGNA
jgi:hypothetical protein